MAALQSAFSGASLTQAAVGSRQVAHSRAGTIRCQASKRPEQQHTCVSRRQLAGALSAGLVLALAPLEAKAVDVPLFGFKKGRPTSGESSAPAFTGPELPSLTPEFQAAGVAGAELVAVAAAGLVVGSITKS